MGSVTLLERFASLKSLRRGDCRREAYGWILENTDSYRYYSDDTKSLAGYESWMRHIAQVTRSSTQSQLFKLGAANTGMAVGGGNDLHYGWEMMTLSPITPGAMGAQ